MRRTRARVPVEAAFLCLAHRLIAPGGRLLAVLPCSVIMADSLQWLRQFLLQNGSVNYVHEFPTRTFPSVDSRIYLMVYEKKRGRIGRIRLVLAWRQPKSAAFDHPADTGGQQARLRIPRRRCTHGDTESQVGSWVVPPGRHCSDNQGTVVSAPRPSGVVHSTDFRDGVWRSPGGGYPTAVEQRGRLRSGDLLIRRVGRNNQLTLGDAALVAGLLATDCVFVIRPDASIGTLELLFAIERLFARDWITSVLERGTGARYLTRSSLEQLQVPLAASTVFRDDYIAFPRTRASRICAPRAKSPNVCCGKTNLMIGGDPVVSGPAYQGRCDSTPTHRHERGVRSPCAFLR